MVCVCYEYNCTFVSMRDAIFYIFLIACFTLLVSSDLNREKVVDEDCTTCLLVDIPNGTEAVITDVDFVFKNQMISFKRFLFLNQTFFGDTYRSKQFFSSIILKFYQLKRLDIKAKKDKISRLLFCLPSNKQDGHDLI